MALSLFVKANDVSKVELYHPATKEHVGTLIIAGPYSDEMKAWRRELNSRRQRRDYREDMDAQIKESLCLRTVGWEGVKDSETGEVVEFDKNALQELYSQSWLVGQVLAAVGEEDFFFKE